MASILSLLAILLSLSPSPWAAATPLPLPPSMAPGEPPSLPAPAPASVLAPESQPPHAPITGPELRPPSTAPGKPPPLPAPAPAPVLAPESQPPHAPITGPELRPPPPLLVLAPPPMPRRGAPFQMVAAPDGKGWDQQMNNIIDALIGSGDFGNWVYLLMAAGSGDYPVLPFNATLFVPDDVALPEPKSDNPNPSPFLIDPFLIAYHVVPQRLTFADLLALAAGARLPTLLPGNWLLITSNSVSNYTVDDAQITHPDLYLNAAVSIQGISAAFDYNRYGEKESEGDWAKHSSLPPPPPRRRSVRRPPSHARHPDPHSSFRPWDSGGSGRRLEPDFLLWILLFSILSRISRH